MELLVWVVVLILLAAVVSPLVLVLSTLHFPSPRTYWHFRKLKGPKGWPLFGVALELAGLKQHEILDYIGDNLLAKYPRITAVWNRGVPSVFLQEPEDIEMVFGSVSHITKGVEYRPLLPWLKEGLLTSTGQKWHTRRKILTPSFHFRILDDSLQTMNRNAVIFAEKLLKSNGQPISIEPLAKLCTLDVICESVMGVTINAQNDEEREYVNAIKRMSEIVIRRELCFWLDRDWAFHLFPTGFEFRRLLKFLHNFADKVINERRKSFIPSKSQSEANEEDEALYRKTRRAFLDTMIEYEANNPNSFTKEDIREEVDTFMFEGHDTTASAVTFTLFLLGTHQDVQRRVVAELFEIFEDSGRAIEMKDLSRMNYLDKVIKESLRIYPSVPYISRALTTDLKLADGVMIPNGTNVIVLPYFLHRNPRVFPNAEKFDPDRFAERSSNKSYHPYGYIPFSAGPRNCIGQKFAMMEIKIIMATVLRRARLESITKTEDLKLLSMLILRPHSDVLMKVTPRESLRSTIHYY